MEGPKGMEEFAVGDGLAWAYGKDRLLSVDPQKQQITSVAIEHVKASFPGYAIARGFLWTLGTAHDAEGIHRIDVSTGKCTATIALKPRKGISSVAYGEGAVWVLSEHDGTLFRINPSTNQVTATIELGKGYWQPLQIADGSIWTIGEDSGIVKRVDPQSNKVVDEISTGRRQTTSLLKEPFKGGIYYFAVGEGTLWVADSKNLSSGEYILWRFDLKTHDRTAQVEVDHSYAAPVIWNGYVWLSKPVNHLAGHYIVEVSTKTNRVERSLWLPAAQGHFFARGSFPPVLVAGENALWAFSPGNGHEPTIVRYIQAKPAEPREK